MNVGAVRDAAPVVALPAQALNPLSASSEPITMSLPARVDLAHKPADRQVHEAAKAQQVQRQRVDRTQAVATQQVAAMINVSGVAQAGRVDVYV